MQHFSISDFTQDTAIHAVDLAIRFQEGRIVTAGNEGLLFPHPGQQILLAAIIQLTEHIVQQEDRVLPGDGSSGGGFGHFQAEHHTALLPLAGKHSGGLAVQQQLQIFPVGAAQALPGPYFLILAGFEQGCQTTRLKLGGIPQLHPLRPMGKLLVIGTGQRSQPFQIGPPPLLDGFPLRGKLGLKYLLHTRSEEGMTLYFEGGQITVPTQAREVYDVSGAGDTVIAILATMLATGMTVEEAVRTANRAAGVVVGKLGTATVSYEELF